MNSNKFHICTKYLHRWPEAIDIDEAGNLYFSDTIEKALYRINRKKDGTLEKKEIKLLKGFKHIAGISIDRESEHLYLGASVRMEGEKNVQHKIIQFPLAILNACTNMLLQDCLNKYNLLEVDIGGRPNGVVFDKKEDVVYYTWERLIDGMLLGKKGHVGKIQFDPPRTSEINMLTPNGIDIDRSAKETTLVVSCFRKNLIGRIIPPDPTIHSPKTLENMAGKILGHGPDGLMLESGDVLVAAFWSHKILYLCWDGNSYKGPFLIEEGLDNPTDLVRGLSSDGNGESLFVTSTVLWRVGLPRSYIGGKVIEITDIGRIENIKRRIKCLKTSE